MRRLKYRGKSTIIWLLVGIALLVVFFVNYYFNFSQLITIFVPVLLAFSPFLKELVDEFREKKSREVKINQEIEKIGDYLKAHFSFKLNPVEIEDFEDEDEIYSQHIKANFSGVNEVEVNSILLCFFCDLWDKSNSTKEHEKIQKYSATIGLSFAEINDKTNVFLKVFSAFNSDKRYDSLKQIYEEDIDNLQVLKNFAERYLKELSFFEIKEILSQSENLRQTLIKLIKEGELSSWGITNETMEKLEADLRREIDYSKTFLVMGNNLSDELRKYLTSQPGLTGWAPSTRNIPNTRKYSAYVVKPRGVFPNAKKLLHKLKSINRDAEETILFVIPLDFLNYESYTLPSNQSFSNKNLKSCYEAINWFRSGYEYSDNDIWNVIGRSNITTHELLSLVPFNIFCEGILPCEQIFMIKNYKSIKQKCGVETLTDWKGKNPSLIVDYLLEGGTPDYNRSEKEQVLDIKNGKIDKAIRSRLEGLAVQIIKNAEKLDKSLTLMEK